MPIPFLVTLAESVATAFATSAAASAANKLVEEFTKEPSKEPSDEKIQELWQRILDELRGELEETRRQLEHEQRKRKKQVMKVIAIGVVCFLLGGLVASLGTWYALQSSQSSEQIIALEELEKYEKARDAGLQALEDYVIQNPNSPYISQAKALIRAYKGKE